MQQTADLIELGPHVVLRHGRLIGHDPVDLQSQDIPLSGKDVTTTSRDAANHCGRFIGHTYAGQQGAATNNAQMKQICFSLEE